LFVFSHGSDEKCILIWYFAFLYTVNYFTLPESGSKLFTLWIANPAAYINITDKVILSWGYEYIDTRTLFKLRVASHVRDVTAS